MLFNMEPSLGLASPGTGSDQRSQSHQPLTLRRREVKLLKLEPALWKGSPGGLSAVTQESNHHIYGVDEDDFGRWPHLVVIWRRRRDTIRYVMIACSMRYTSHT